MSEYWQWQSRSNGRVIAMVHLFLRLPMEKPERAELRWDLGYIISVYQYHIYYNQLWSIQLEHHHQYDQNHLCAHKEQSGTLPSILDFILTTFILILIGRGCCHCLMSSSVTDEGFCPNQCDVRSRHYR